MSAETTESEPHVVTKYTAMEGTGRPCKKWSFQMVLESIKISGMS